MKANRTNDRPTQSSTDLEADPDVVRLGVDARGQTLYFDEDARVIHAVDAAGGRDRLPLAEDRTVAEFQDAVEARVGWAEVDTRYVSAGSLFGGR